MSNEELQIIERKVDDLLVELWNDIVNRRAGEIVFKDASDILQVREQLLTIIKGVAKA